MTTREELAAAIDAVAADTAFSGVVRVDGPDGEVLGRAFGFADRAHRVPMTTGTRIGVASGAKAFTALTVMRLVEEGALALGTRARDLLGADLPLIDDAVTVEHLLSHRSGIGDYLDEDEIDDTNAYVMPLPLHTLDRVEAYLGVLDGHDTKFPPGTDFSYCNGGFCVLAILAERAARTPFHDLVREQVLERAGLLGTAYLRSDELPADAALGYLHAEGLRTNVLHLPVVGGGDGGIYTTAADVSALWAALEAGAVVSADTWTDMQRDRSPDDEDDSYGLGIRLWGDAACLVGSDAGATFHSARVADGLTRTVLSNTTDGAWPMVEALDTALFGVDSAPTLGTDPFDVR